MLPQENPTSLDPPTRDDVWTLADELRDAALLCGRMSVKDGDQFYPARERMLAADSRLRAALDRLARP